jgi:tetratricopeptide (TPR) repeat protein
LVLANVSQPTVDALLSADQRKDYPAALAIHPDDPTLWDHWITGEIAAHQLESALAVLYRAVNTTGWTMTRRWEIGDLLAARSDLDAASAYRRSLLTDFPNDVDLLRQLIAADLTMRAWPDATVLLKRLVALVPNDSAALYELAVLMAPDQPSTALTYLGQTANDPAYRDRAATASRALSGGTPATQTLKLAVQLSFDQQWSLAEYVLDQALPLNGANAQVLALLGLAQEQQGRDGWALIQQAFSLAPNDPVVINALALHWQQMGNPDAALAVLTQAEAHDPNNPALAVQIGLAYQQRQALDEAVHWLTIAVQLAPDDPSFTALLAAFYADEHYALDLGGLTFIQDAAQRFSQNADIHASLGAALLASGQIGAALPELHRAITLDPASVRAQYYLGTALEQSGDVIDAKSSYWTAFRVPVTIDNTLFHNLAGRALQRLGQPIKNS